MGSIFWGGVIPQKLDLASHLETQYAPIQRHASFYEVEIRECCFVWAAPTLLQACTHSIMEKHPGNIRS
jgi:hypothetical protein